MLILNATTLHQVASIALPGAFGKPVWLDESDVLVAGENDDAIEDVDLRRKTVTRIALPRGSWPAQVAISPDHKLIAVSDDRTGDVSFGALAGHHLVTLHIGGAAQGPLHNFHDPSDVLFSPDGRLIYVALRGSNRVIVIDDRNASVQPIVVGLHPDALALSKDGKLLYVAESDDDSLGIVDRQTRKRIADIDLRLRGARVDGYGASPNALAVGRTAVYVSLGAENAVAVVRNRRVVGRIPTGWYPSGVAIAAGGNLYIADGKGESSPANPTYNGCCTFGFRPGVDTGYVAASLHGSIRVVDARLFETNDVVANVGQHWNTPRNTVIRADGPIKHIIYIIKENRSYDQVLGDVPGADGDPRLTWFGRRITPNEHAIVERFGVFDRAFADAQVSADGHNWSTAAIANDYVERFWTQGSRRNLYDYEDGDVAGVPHDGYLWDDAAREGVTYRDYGEFVELPTLPGTIAVSHMPHLADGHVAPHYPGWNLNISDQVRFDAWKTEFDRYRAHGDLPALEIVRLPNDHTMGTRPGALTPQAYVAQNDYALGEIVDVVSHSSYWATTAIFAIEDDAQDGPDHVDDQRTTLYVASPYALPGTHHAEYTTASVLHTIEIILGLKPMTVYDATAQPLYAAFSTRPVNMRPFDAIPPRINVHARNSSTAYGAQESMRLDFSHADQANPQILDDILAHAAKTRMP